MPLLSRTPSLPLRPIAAALVASLSLAPYEARATLFVGNCADNGTGSLRDALNHAAEGELIDATGLSLVCSKISLTTGVLIVANNAQKIDGPGAGNLTIDATGNTDGGPVFFHNGHGTLEIDHVTITHGNKYLNDNTKHVGGGCISSLGSLELTQAVVSNCTMSAGPDSHAKGGAIYANGDLTLTQSLVTGSSTHGASPFGYEMNTYGGGVFAKGTITLDRSTVSGNSALNGGGIYSSFDTAVYSSTVSDNAADVGGGINCRCALQISYSTIANNHARTNGGLLLGFSYTSGPRESFIRNSTITGNTISGTFSAAAMEAEIPLSIFNSTIAFNVAPLSTEGALYSDAATLILESTIISDNYPADVDVQTGYTVISGAKNLSPNSIATMPGDTKTECPLLEPLAWNGGPTQTHALRHTSPAINAGNNLLLPPYDQRGTGFPRSFGGVPDIGAWEWQGNMIDDSIFHQGFDPGLGLCHT